MNRQFARLILVIGLAGLPSCQTGQPGREGWFLTQAEADALESAPVDPEMDVSSRGGEEPVVVLQKTDGPAMEFVRPSNDTPSLKSPVEVVIKFVPQDSPADPTTLIVKICKHTIVGCRGRDDINKELTARLKSFTTADGINASGLEVPTGTFRVKLEVADQKGKTTIATVRITIVT